MSAVILIVGVVESVVLLTILNVLTKVQPLFNFTGTIYLTDINGRIIEQIELENQIEKTIDFPLPAGVYFLKIMSVGHEETLKLLKM